MLFATAAPTYPRPPVQWASVYTQALEKIEARRGTGSRPLPAQLQPLWSRRFVGCRRHAVPNRPRVAASRNDPRSVVAQRDRLVDGTAGEAAAARSQRKSHRPPVGSQPSAGRQPPPRSWRRTAEPIDNLVISRHLVLTMDLGRSRWRASSLRSFETLPSDYVPVVSE